MAKKKYSEDSEVLNTAVDTAEVEQAPAEDSEIPQFEVIEEGDKEESVIPYNPVDNSLEEAYVTGLKTPTSEWVKIKFNFTVIDQFRSNKKFAQLMTDVKKETKSLLDVRVYNTFYNLPSYTKGSVIKVPKLVAEYYTSRYRKIGMRWKITAPGLKLPFNPKSPDPRIGEDRKVYLAEYVTG